MVQTTPYLGFQWLSGKESAYNAGDMGLIPGSGRSPGGGNDNPLQYSCQENPKDRGAWRTIVHGVTKSWTQLSSHTHRTITSLPPEALVPRKQSPQILHQNLLF